MNVTGGKATKRTRLGKITASIARGTVRAAQSRIASGMKYHVVDAEWKMNYLHDDEVADLLRISDASITTILTYSTRHSYCERNIRQARMVASGFENFGLCLVAGNAAYLDADERRRPLARTIREAVKTVKRDCEDREVWIGTEGVLRLASEPAIEHNLTPFLLFDRGLESNIQYLRDRGFTGDFAIYVPFYVSANRRRVLHDVLYRLSGYMLRRRWVREEARRLNYDLSLPLLRSLVQEKRPLSKKLMKSPLGTLLAEAAHSLSVFGNSGVSRKDCERSQDSNLELSLAYQSRRAKIRSPPSADASTSPRSEKTHYHNSTRRRPEALTLPEEEYLKSQEAVDYMFPVISSGF